MARPFILEPLQVFPFWLLDVGPEEQLGLPLLTPLYGFSTISSPEIVADSMDVAEGNWYFSRKVLKRFNISNITMTRGVTWFDSDFWKWMIAGTTGSMKDLSSIPFLGAVGSLLGLDPLVYRRTLILIEYFPHFPNTGNDVINGIITNIGTVGMVAGAAGIGSEIPSAGVLVSTGIATAVKSAIGPFELAPRLPARAFLLKGCVPVRYKSGSDLDAQSGAVMVSELEIAVEIIEEISLGA
jgi:hypothetical protein